MMRWTPAPPFCGASSPRTALNITSLPSGRPEVVGESDWLIVLRARESRVHGEGASKVTQPAKETSSRRGGLGHEATSLRGIANRVASDKAHRFQNLFGLLNVGFLLWCWQFVNPRAAGGVDRKDARSYQENLQENLEALVVAVKGGRYRAKLVLRRYIPKLNGKLRPLGIPALADKVLQIGVSKILEAIYEQDFLGCSYGYRPGVGALDAVRDLSAALRSGRYHYLVEADIRSFFDRIDHAKLMELLERRIDDRPFLRLIRKWLKVGILEPDGTVNHPEQGSPQGGSVSPILANIYLHYALDVWFEETVRARCRGAVYLCRYAGDSTRLRLRARSRCRAILPSARKTAGEVRVGGGRGENEPDPVQSGPPESKWRLCILGI
jgi:group II intron reverse transcriptase/maturase